MTTQPFDNTPLGDAVLNIWGLQVDTSGTMGKTPTWLAVRGIYDFKDQLDTKTIDVSDFQAGMWEDSQSSTKSWGADFKCWRKNDPANAQAQTAPAYDPGQEYLRLHAGQSVHIRYFEMGGDGTAQGGVPRIEAYEGNVSVKWAPDGGKHTDGRSVSCTLAGKGIRNSIQHPYPNS